MSNFVRLKSGVEIPEGTLLETAHRIRKLFVHHPERAMKFVILANHDFDEEMIEKYLPNKYELNSLKQVDEFYIGPLPREGKICNGKMARSALAMNMIVVNEEYDDLEGYLQEPLLSDREILNEIHLLAQKASAA